MLYMIMLFINLKIETCIIIIYVFSMLYRRTAVLLVATASLGGFKDALSSSFSSSCSSLARESEDKNNNVASSSSSRGTSPRTTYLRSAEIDRSMLGVSDKMREFYFQDVASRLENGNKSTKIIGNQLHYVLYGYDSTGNNSSSSSSISNSNKKRNIKNSREVRIAQWNMNVLHGYKFDASAAVDAAAAVSTVQGFDADVILIQEGGVQSFPFSDSKWADTFNWNGSKDRIIEFQKRLKEIGYQLYFAEGVPNPSLIAVRKGLKIVDIGDSFCIDKNHGHYEEMLTHWSKETRSARFVSVEFPIEDGGSSSPIISFCVTHLHHTEKLDGKSAKGIRHSEILAILENSPKEIGGKVPITMIATDFNQCRQKDYNDREWALISAALDGINEPNPTDNVAEELEKHGYKCTFDLIPSENKPAFTHWTSTIVDFGYLLPGAHKFTVSSVEVIPCGLSDHLPVIHNIIIHDDK